MLTRSYPHYLRFAMLGLLSLFMTTAWSNDNAFHIECPDDVTIDCGDDTDDLSDYGWAYVYGYGDPQPAPPPAVHYYLNDCGTGFITRTWSASDYSGNVYSCTQYIYVGGGGTFNEYDINWPPDYYTTDCGADFDPDWLPAPYDYPTYSDEDCAMIMIGYDDQVFNGDGCKKVLRRWKVIDWCVYDPNDPYTGGRWEHTQILKVRPDAYGGNVILNCIDDITVSANGDCTGAYVNLEDVTGEGVCGSDVAVTNFSPYADHPGPNASGFYPLGTTKVIFRGKDGCGNIETCQIYITIKDLKKPSPVCLNGITANLMIQPGGGYWVDIEAEWFDYGSFDNCTPSEDLIFDVSPSHFTCDDLGRQDVKVYVTDAHGNTQYCNTYIIIQDNMGMCPPPDTGSVSGHVTNSASMPLKGVALQLSNGVDSWNTVTDVNGRYIFDDVIDGPTYSIKGLANGNAADGVSTLDLLYISQYIIGLRAFNQSHQPWAADVNMDGTVNILDLSVLRKLLLQTITDLPHHKAWRLIDAEDGDIMDLNQVIRESFTIEDINGDHTGFDFVAVKLGDINNSAAADGTVRSNDAITMSVADEYMKAGKAYVLSFKVPEIHSVQGWQGAIKFTDLDYFDIAGYGDVAYAENAFRIDWDRQRSLISFIDPQGVDLLDHHLMQIEIVPNQDGFVHEFISLSAADMQPELYVDEKVLSLSLEYEEVTSNEIQKKMELYPNPFDDELYISLPIHQRAKISILDAQGRLISQVNQSDGGLTSLPIKANMNPGIYWVEIITDDERTVQKVIKK